MKGVLVRVGIDSTCGGWNSPLAPQTGRFAYVPIPEGDEDLHPRLIRRYGEVLPALEAMGVALPPHLDGRPMHLDPDFGMLTYGDVWPRSKPLLDLRDGDFVAFYSSLKPITPSDAGLVYALIGVYMLGEVVRADDVPQACWHENAHTRRREHGNDLIVRARKVGSGRFDKAIPVGEYRDRAYRVRPDLLSAWGGLTVKDGYIQRSGRLPEFLKPERFLKWLEEQNRQLWVSNNQ